MTNSSPWRSVGKILLILKIQTANNEHQVKLLYALFDLQWFVKAIDHIDCSRFSKERNRAITFCPGPICFASYRMFWDIQQTFFDVEL